MEKPRIIKYDGNDYNFEVILEMEYTEFGNLSDFLIKKLPKLPEDIMNLFIRGVIKGLSFLHKNKMVHCDLKPDNILVFWDKKKGRFVFKIADLGGSFLLQENIKAKKVSVTKSKIANL